MVEGFEKSYKSFGLTYRLTEVNYPAVAIANLQLIFEAYISAGRAYEFGASVEKGVEDVLGYREYIRWKCPDTKFALIGYSQGAMVVKDAAKSFTPDELGFLLTLGDPETYLPEGEGWFPRACTSSNIDYSLSRWRYYAPECHTFEGLFGGAKPYEPDQFRNKYALMCNANDFICGSSHNPFRNDGHTSYAGGSLIVDAVHDLVDAKFRMDWVNLLEGLTERPVMGTLSSVEQNGFGMRRIDGNRLLVSWHASPDVEYVLISLNGVVLGYVDAARGEIEIRDLDYRVENKIGVSYLSADGENVESETYEPPTAILPLDEEVPDSSPVIAGEPTVIMDGPEELFEPEVSIEGDSADVHDDAAANDGVGPAVEAPSSSEELPSIVASPESDTTPIGLRKVSSSSATSGKNVAKIIVAVLGASAVVILFWFGRRH